MQERFIQANVYMERQQQKLQRLKTRLLGDKINHPFMVILVMTFSFVSAIGIARFGLKAGVLTALAIIAVPAVYAVIAYPNIGIILSLIIAYFLLFAEKFTDFPVGTLMDGMLMLLIFGFFLKQKVHSNWKIFKNPVSIMILIWIGYNLIQVANPFAESRLAWIYTVRTVAVVLLMHFIFLYHIRSVQAIRLIFKIWIGLSLFAALYGLNQHFFGFFPFEEAWLADNPTAVSLYFIGGIWRKFSIFSDPVTFAYNMVISSILCICLATGTSRTWKKIILLSIASICIFSMLHSGTRGAYIMVPVALGMFLILNFSKKILVISLVLSAIMAAIVFAPTSNPSIQRFQSAFSPEYDASFNVRKANQKMIQPFILTHPIGGGLGATGTWGQRFSPNSFLANFPPDSGYVRVAVEIGWIGLAIFCILIFIVLRIGIINYYKIKDPELKSYSMAMVLVVFALHIGNYPQEALVQYPTNILFSLVLALIIALPSLDKKGIHSSQEINNDQGNH